MRGEVGAVEEDAGEDGAEEEGGDDGGEFDAVDGGPFGGVCGEA